jgi:hypothetical protein
MNDVISAATLNIAELTFSQLADIPSFIPQYKFFYIGNLVFVPGLPYQPSLIL